MSEVEAGEQQEGILGGRDGAVAAEPEKRVHAGRALSVDGRAPGTWA